MAMSAAAFPRQPGGDAVVTVVSRLHLPANPQRPVHTGRLLVAAFDSQWRERGQQQQTFEVRSPESPGPHVVADVSSRLVLPPGRYELRIAGESAGVTGSVFTDLDIPDVKKEVLWLSVPVLGTRAQPRLMPTTFEGVIPVQPVVARVFGPADHVTAFVRVYHRATKTQVIVKATVLNEAGGEAAAHTSPVQGRRTGSVHTGEFLFDLPLDRLSPGSYLLKLEASVEMQRVERLVRFRIE